MIIITYYFYFRDPYWLLFYLHHLLLALTARKSVRPLSSHLLALRYTSHHLDHFTSGSSSSHLSSDHSSSGHSILGHSLPGHSSPNLTIRSAPSSTLYLPTTSELSVGDSSSESSAGPSHKRCRSPAATVTSSIQATRALVPSRADLLPPRKRFRDSISPEDSVAVDRDVMSRIDAGIDMEVNVGVDVEDKVEDEVEYSDRGTMEVGVDVVAEIDIPDGMFMPDVVEHLEQRIEDIETGQRELKARSLIDGGERVSLLEQVASLERSNARLRDTIMMERAKADRFRRCVSFIESELRKILRFCYYDRMRFRRLETFAARRLGFRP
ncbi:hypothetical protein Tco_0569992 [Tanacetum coccineum]